MIVLAYLLISISVSSIVGIFYIAYYCFFFAHCTCFLYFVLITLVTIGVEH